MNQRSLYTLIILVLFFDHVVGSLLDSCPNNYTVKRTNSDRKSVIYVKKNKSRCERISRDDSYQMVPNDDLLPRRSVIKKDGEYYLSVTWTSRIVDGKFPRIFLIFLEYSIPGRDVTNNMECVVLKIKGRKAAENEISSDFRFDCIKLLDMPEESAGHVSIEIWNYSNKQSGPGCRSRRAVAPSNTCKTVECSHKRYFSLSRGLYETEFCSCYKLNYGEPEVTSEFISKENTIDFRGTVTNLPDFMVTLSLNIKREGESVWSLENDNRWIVRNGTFSFITDGLKPVDGNYSLLISIGCKYFGSESLVMNSKCEESISYETFLHEVTIDVKNHNDEIKLERLLKFFVVIGLSAVFIATTVTVVFVYFKRRNKPQQHRFDSDTRVGNQEVSNPFLPTGGGVVNCEELVSATYTAEMDSLSTQASRTEPTETYTQNTPVLVLHHEADLDPTLRELHRTFNLKDAAGRDLNWRKFASNALSNHYHIVILLSEGLLDLLCGNSDVKQQRLVERLYENVPEIVLKDLESLIKNYPERSKDHFVHIVSSNCEEGRSLTKRFLEIHAFIKSMTNYSVYYMSKELNDADLLRLKSNLEREHWLVTCL